MTRIRTLGVAALVSLTACDGLKEALTAHVDVVASAGSQELSVQHMAEMMGKSQVPVRREVAQSIADAWVNFHLLGEAAVRNDSLTDKKLIDEVMWPVTTQAKVQKFGQLVSASFVVDTTNLAEKYARGDLLAARHILFSAPAGDAKAADSVMKVAEGVRARTTSANFAQLARQYGSDGTKEQGGDLGVFPPNMMVPEFAQAVAALKPGEIGPLVRTQFGFHIVRRSTYDEVKDAFGQQYLQRAQFVAESTYVAGVESAGKIELEPTVVKTVKAVAEDPAGHADDRTTLARTRYGAFRASDFARRIEGFPNPQQIRGQIGQAPDSLLIGFVRNVLRQELLLKAADSAKVTMDSTEQAGLYSSFASILYNSWAGLGISPHVIADSAKTQEERARVVPARIEAYMTRLINGQDQFVEVPSPLVQALRQKYDWKISSAGIDRAVEAATTIRAKEDSARAAALPKSAVPMPTPRPDSGTPPAGKQ
jgi:hypothetical protein